MGPSTLFDKSFLQSLSIDEAAVFDAYFRTSICPIFFVETLADLAKEKLREGRKAEDEVRIIADKCPQMGSVACAHHTDLCLNSLMGDVLPMNGQIPVPGGQRVREGSERGVTFAVANELQAMSRWQHEQFADLERDYARVWREQLKKLDLEAAAKKIQAIGINGSTCRTLQEAYDLAARTVADPGMPFQKIAALFSTAGISERYMRPVLERWALHGYPALTAYAPYAAHILKVELFFRIAMAASLVSHDRPSNRTDIAYLLYLPFTMIFVSSDRLHEKCAPLFLRDDQQFVPGGELKAELKRMSAELLLLPDAERERGLLALCGAPTGPDDCLLVKLWDRFLPSWRTTQSRNSTREHTDPGRLDELVRRMKESPVDPSTDFVGPNDWDHVSMERSVQQRRGNHWMLPKDLPDPALSEN